MSRARARADKKGECPHMRAAIEAHEQAALLRAVEDVGVAHDLVHEDTHVLRGLSRRQFDALVEAPEGPLPHTRRRHELAD